MFEVNQPRPSILKLLTIVTLLIEPKLIFRKKSAVIDLISQLQHLNTQRRFCDWKTNVVFIFY